MENSRLTVAENSRIMLEGQDVTVDCVYAVAEHMRVKIAHEGGTGYSLTLGDGKRYKISISVKDMDGKSVE